MMQASEPKTKPVGIAARVRGVLFRKAWIDLILVFVAIKVSIWIGAELDLFEVWVEFAHSHEDWELDELTIGAFTGMIGLAWFAWRRAQENVKLRREAEQANQAKSEFLAAMSHELRTPLNAVVGFSEIIEKQMLGPVGSPKYIEYAGHIHHSGRFLVSLVEDILDLSKVASGKLELTKTEVDVALVTDSVLDTMAPIAAQRGVFLHLDVARDISPVTADQRALTQILLNLVTNAVKFSRKGGDIYVCVAEGHGRHVFEVRDTGCGMPEHIVEKVMEPFVQHGLMADGGNEGVGLGLAIVKGLVHAHGGTIKIESIEGQGTTVRFSLPSGADAAGGPLGNPSVEGSQNAA